MKQPMRDYDWPDRRSTKGRRIPTAAYRASALVVIALVVLLSGCSGGEDDSFPLDGTVLSMSEISGNWSAVSAVFSRAAAGPVLDVDVLAAGGTVTMSIQNDGRFTLIRTRSEGGTVVTAGHLGFDEDLLVVFYDDAPDDWEYFSIDLTSGTLTVQGPGEYDFDGNGIDEAANLYLSFVRTDGATTHGE